MARINKIRFAGWALMMYVLLCLGGCASYEARKAYNKAELLAAEENYDAAFEKYSEAAELDPSSKKYKLELIAIQTKAAIGHLRKARQLTARGDFTAALIEYGRAREFDPGIEVIEPEERELVNLLKAQELAEEGAGFYGQRNSTLAMKAIDKALKLDANNVRALAIKDLLDRDKKVFMDGVELDVASEDPITLSFKDANIKEVFGILSQLSGINFIFDEEIRSQSISVLLEKASFSQAMELIMQMNGLGKKVLNSKTIIIYPESREKDKQYGDQIIQTFYLSHIDAKKAVNLLRTMLQLRKIYVHEERNALVVRDKPEVIRLAEQILLAADRENSEVIFDLELVAVSSGDQLDFGPKLNASSSTVGFGTGTEKTGDNTISVIPDSTITSSLSGLTTYFTVPSATFDLAKTLTDSEILASPKIRVRNREKAKVHIGTREPVITVTQNGDNYSDSVQYVDVGVKLDVEPNIQLDRTVETKLKLEVSQKIGETTTTRGTKVLTISTTNAETVLTLQDGVQTIIGGLFEQQDSSSRNTIPFLGEIPFLGSLFTNFSNNDIKREILLSITPYIIRQVDVPDVDTATIWSGGEDNLKNGPNFGSFVQNLMSEVEATKPLAAPSIKPMQLEQIVAVEATSQTDESPVDNQIPVVIAATEEVIPSDEAVPTEAPVVAEEVVPTEVMEEIEELGAPIVLEMPKKAPATINFDGPLQVDQGEEFAVAVQVKDVEQLYSAPLFVSYDPALLELVNISEGTFLKQDGQSTVFSSSPNRTTGQVIVGYKQGTGGKGASGSGDLFSLNFKTIAVGEAKLEINRVNFRNPEGVRLQVVPEAVIIEVR